MKLWVLNDVRHFDYKADNFDEITAMDRRMCNENNVHTLFFTQKEKRIDQISTLNYIRFIHAFFRRMIGDDR